MYVLNPSATTLLLVPLLGWRIYARFRRMVGRQRLSKYRPWITLTIFPALLTWLAWTALSHGQMPWWLCGGLVVGIGLGIFGLGKTKFERMPKGLFYTPNAHLGIALSLVFVARIAYRMIEVYVVDPDAPHGMADFAHSTITLAVFGVLAGYYIAYAAGLARWRLRVMRAKRQRETGKSIP